MKTFFMNDYGEGAHPLVMRRLMETNMEHTCGYGLDEYSLRAADVIREKCGQPGAAVHIMTGGTSANSIAIAAFLRPYEAAICAPTGHINVHETGAVEATGHKVLPCAAKDGKVTAEGVEAVCALHTDEHMVAPRLLYVSQPTEIGTVYHLDELKALRRVCDAHGLILFVDGARLGSALTSPECDMTLKDLAALADCFYIGGTKCGALLGEAVVIPQPGLIPHFFTIIKQHGALLAKGRLLGIQFDTLFTDGLYERIGADAVRYADAIRRAMAENGYLPCFPSPTNQSFCIVSEQQRKELAERVDFSVWEQYDETHSIIRFATSWATREEDVNALCRILRECTAQEKAAS